MKLTLFICLIPFSLASMEQVTMVERNAVGKNIIYFGKNVENKIVVAAIFLRGGPNIFDQYEHCVDTIKLGNDSLSIYRTLENRYYAAKETTNSNN